MAEGATILTHNNNEQVLERLLSGPRTLMGDSLSKVTTRRTDVASLADATGFSWSTTSATSAIS